MISGRCFGLKSPPKNDWGSARQQVIDFEDHCCGEQGCEIMRALPEAAVFKGVLKKRFLPGVSSFVIVRQIGMAAGADVGADADILMAARVVDMHRR